MENHSTHRSSENVLIDLGSSFNAFANTVEDAVIAIKADSTIVFVNHAVEKTFGYSPTHLLGRKVTILVPEYPQAVQAVPLRVTQAPDRRQNRNAIEVVGLSRDHREIPLLLSFAEFIKDGEQYIAMILHDLREQKLAENKLRESEQRYKSLFQYNPDAICSLDLNGKVLQTNDACCQVTGHSKATIVGESLEHRMVPEDFPRLRRSFLRARQGRAQSLKTSFIHRDGRRLEISLTLLPIVVGEKIVGVFAVAKDDTEHFRAETQVRASQQQYESLVNSIEGIVWQAEVEPLRFTFVSRHAERLLGYPVEQWLSEPGFWENHIHPEDREWVVSSCDAITRRKKAHQLEYRMIAKDGQTVWLRDFVQGVAHGAKVRPQGIMFDITERKRIEAERQAIFEIVQGANETANQEEFFRLVREAISKVTPADNCLIALKERGTKSLSLAMLVDVHANRPAQVLFSKSLAEHVFRTGRPLLMTEPVFRRLAEQGEIEQAEIPPAVWLGVPIKTPAKAIGVLAVQHYEECEAFSARDVEFLSTVGGQMALVIERKHAEESLRKSEELYRDMVENAIDIIYTHDLSGRYLSLNRAGEKITGYTREEALKMNLADTVVPEQLEFVRQRIKDKLAGAEQSAYKVEIITKDRRRVTVEANTRLVYEHGVPVAVQGVARDITASEQLENQLRHAQKMESLGHLAGGIAHDFNNLLVVINGYAELLLRQSQDSSLRKKLMQIKTAGDRATGLTRQLLAFSRKQVLQPKVLDLNEIVSSTSLMLERLIGEDIELVPALEPALGRVKADPGQMEQIIINLVVNARDAMPQGGKLIIETANSYLDEGYARGHVTVQPGPYVMLAVSDTGVGMDAKTQSQIFEPFFTTKEAGKGTGLGLATVYGIVKQSEGYVCVYSERGRGTTFKVYLPQAIESDVEADTSLLAAKLAEGRETILLVEDESSVRTLAHEVLEDLGYRVLVAAYGEEAISLSQQHLATIDLLVTDVVMPGMSGRQVAERLAALHPNMKVLFMSGYTDEAILHHGVIDPKVDFLQKPFALDVLARKVREVLDRKS